jgi:hypothetical protein
MIFGGLPTHVLESVVRLKFIICCRRFCNNFLSSSNPSMTAHFPSRNLTAAADVEWVLSVFYNFLIFFELRPS